MSNPLLALFPEPSASTPPMDWPNPHAERGFVICFTGRCGSTELVDVLAQSGLCGRPDEYFNEEFVPHHNLQWQAQSLGEYVEHLVASTSSGGLFGFKIDGFRHRRLCELVDPETLFPSTSFTYFYLTRRNLVEQAFSYASAKATGLWHVRNQNGQPSVSTPNDHTFSDTEVWHELALILEQEFYFERVFVERRISARRIDYEMICASKVSLVADILFDLGCSSGQVSQALAGAKQNLRKLQYSSGYHQQLVDFLGRHRTLVAYLAGSRGRIPFATVRNFLAKEAGIEISQE